MAQFNINKHPFSKVHFKLYTMANIKHVRRRRQPRQVPHHLRHTYLMRPMLTGKVFVCGSNDAGQLGIEDVEEKTSPVLLESLRSKDFVDITCGGMHSVALDSEGNVSVRLGTESHKV